jgi:hypothetical protein
MKRSDQDEPSESLGPFPGNAGAVFHQRRTLLEQGLVDALPSRLGHPF